jgi:hypothetical protein
MKCLIVFIEPFGLDPVWAVPSAVLSAPRPPVESVSTV